MTTLVELSSMRENLHSDMAPSFNLHHPSNDYFIYTHYGHVLKRCDTSPEVSKHNWRILSQDNNLCRAIINEGKSSLRYGFKFQIPSFLKQLFHLNPLWPCFKRNLMGGINYPLSPLEPLLRKIDLEETLDFGNHKGVVKNKQFITKILNTDLVVATVSSFHS